jgi:hypothetical protein
MSKYSETRPPFKPKNSPHRRNFSDSLRVVRSASVWQGDAHSRASTFVMGDNRCWCLGYVTPEGLEPDAEHMLGRHAEAAERDQHRQTARSGRAA